MSVTSATKHMPGPWRAGKGYGVANVEIESGGRPSRIVAFVPTKEPVEGKDIPGTVWVPSEEREANARLIAAAPDLLAALEDTNCSVCDVYIGEPAPEGEEPCYMCATARKAIAKARGGAGE